MTPILRRWPTPLSWSVHNRLCSRRRPLEIQRIGRLFLYNATGPILELQFRRKRPLCE